MADKLILESDFGGFSSDGREYVIRKPDTPRPWVNVISNGRYGLIVSQVGGGFSWFDHSNLNRLTRWQQDLIRDDWGKYIYIRDDETGDFWSPTFLPARKSLDTYECRHGMGYTVFHARYDQVEVRWRLFVPKEESLEIWSVTVRNVGQRKRFLSIVTYLEWCLGVCPDIHREFHKTFLETEYSRNLQGILARKRLWEVPSAHGHWNTNWPGIAFFLCSMQPDSFEGDKEAFVGRNGDLSSPRALRGSAWPGRSGKWGDSIAALRRKVTLDPGEEQTIHFFLGVKQNQQEIEETFRALMRDGAVEAKFLQVKQMWAEFLDSGKVVTPDPAVNVLMNGWLRYQCISGRLWGRAAYYQQSGAYGYRDQLQDSQIFLYFQPEKTKSQILLHAAHQFPEGHVLHWWHPLIEEGLESRMSDDLLWLPFITIQYLKETADWTVLDEEVPFFRSDEKAPLLEHCIRAIDLVLTRKSARGFPLILAGDWNDGLSAVGIGGKGESLWLAEFLYIVLKEMAEVLNQLNQKELGRKAQEYLKEAEKLKIAVNRYGWDGSYFWRATKDSGERIGSQKNRYGKIFLNPQTWAIISGVVSDDRKRILWKSVEDELECEVGPLLLRPAYHQPDPEIGYLTRYAPGTRENGSVYTHAATWAIWAACLLKRNETAYRFLRKILPSLNGLKPDRYAGEPYVTPGNIDGPDSAHYGRGGWTWYTGSAAWLYRVVLDYVIGIRADYDGLIVDPCIPASWNYVEIERLFRGVNYRIQIHNGPGGRVKRIEVNGKTLRAAKIPILRWGEEVKVKIELE